MNSTLRDNLFALSAKDEKLFSRLAGIKPSNRYAFQESRSGEIVPAFLQNGEAQPLHSMVDPKREAQRLIETMPQDTGFLIFLGLGGGFVPQTALEQTDARIIVIEYCLDNIVELFSSVNYAKLLLNDRLTLLVDPTGEEIKNFILEHYLPALRGGIKVIPLRTRIEQDREKFEEATLFIQEAIENVSGDYSVQAHFGMRMFSNIIRNVNAAAQNSENFFAEKKSRPIRETAIVAAGPSLDLQLPSIAELKAKGTFLISSDTALPVLLHNSIEPDAVVSIDCQHISYYHFVGCNLRNIPLVLDIASPPLLSSFASPVFFSGGHPLARYICAHWKPFTQLDTSGGNVTYACLSLAEIIGADHITLFGADFSYIRSQTYSRGTYIYPYFYKKQNRFSPAESQFSTFLYRSPFLPPENEKIKNYYETSSLRFYRKKLEEKVSMMTASVSCAQGEGAPINLKKSQTQIPPCDIFSEKASVSGAVFLEQYRNNIAALPAAKRAGGYMENLNENERQVFITLLPYAAALKKRNMELKREDLIEETKRRSVEEIERTLTTPVTA